MKDQIFISHSNPEDNFFAFWLAAKLKQCGYNVWVDVDDLKGGEFWNRIHNTIRNDTIKFIACISADYIKKSQNPKSGVYKELVAAGTVDVDDFILPIMLDGSNWNDIPIHSLGMIGAPFNKNWRSGLKQILEYFDEEKILKPNHSEDLKNFWYKALLIDDKPIEKDEVYHTNWFEIVEPKTIYIHGLYQEDFQQLPKNFPYVRKKNAIICFKNSDWIEQFTHVRESREEDFTTFLDLESNNYYSFYGYKLYKPNWIVMDLLRKVIEDHFSKGKYFTYDYSSNAAFFNSKPKNNVSLKHLKKTRKSISGTAYKHNNWFYGLSFNFGTYPILHLKANSRVIFTSEEGDILPKDIQHKYRRGYCNNWYNRDWLERMLAFFADASEAKDYLSIPLDVRSELLIKATPLNYETEFGYIEPTKD